MRKLIIFIIAFTTLLVPGPAGAAPTNDESLAMAESYWGGTQCAGRASIAEEQAVADKGHGGWVTGTYTTPNDMSTWVPDCKMALRPGMDDWQRCVVIFHEVGHWKTGAGHSGPGTPMDGESTYEHEACNAAWQAGHQVTAHGAVPEVHPEPVLAPKEQTEAEIREGLPKPRATWVVFCRPAPKGWWRCAARRPGATKRCYDGRPNEHWQTRCNLRPAKTKQARRAPRRAL